MTVKRKIFTTLIALCLGSALFAGGQKEEPVHIKLATTTSTENSGLLAELLPVFQKDENIQVDVIAVGTGKAIGPWRKRRRRCHSGSCQKQGGRLCGCRIRNQPPGCNAQ